MKKKKNDKRYLSNITPRDYVHYIDEFWGDFHDTKNTKEKLDHFGNIITCMFMYFVSRYDTDTYREIEREEFGGMDDE